MSCCTLLTVTCRSTYTATAGKVCTDDAGRHLTAVFALEEGGMFRQTPVSVPPSTKLRLLAQLLEAELPPSVLCLSSFSCRHSTQLPLLQ